MMTRSTIIKLHEYLPYSSGIYQIVNNVTQKRYIGYASKIRRRISGHIWELIRGIHKNSYLQKAWNRYGRYNFSFSVIEECPKENMCAREDYWCTVFNTHNRYYGYNLQNTDPLGFYTQSEETIEKLRKANKGKRPSDAAMAGSRAYHKGRKHTEEEKAKRGLAISKAKKLKHPRRRKVYNTQTGEVYESLAYVSLLSGIPSFELSRRLLGKRKNNTNYKYV